MFTMNDERLILTVISKASSWEGRKETLRTTSNEVRAWKSI